MKPKTVYRVWTGYEIMELESPPQEGDGRVLRGTNLLDKEGQEIFECDIVAMIPLRRELDPINGVVEYDERRQVFVVRHGATLTRLDTEWYRVAVTGNAFETLKS